MASSYRIVIFVVFLSLMSFCGCASRPKALPTTQPTPNVDHVLSSLRRRNNDLKSFRGIGRFKAARGTNVKSFRTVWIGSQPQNLRLQTLGPWGQPSLIFVINGPTFLLHSRQDDRFFRDDATARNLSRFLSIPVRAEDLFTLLSGQPPILPFHRAKIRSSTANSGWLISLYKKWGRLVEKIWLKDNATTVKQVAVFDGWGHLEYRVAFSEFQQVDSRHLSHRVEISDSEGPLWSLIVERFWTNITVPDRAYTLEDIAGTRLTEPNSR